MFTIDSNSDIGMFLNKYGYQQFSDVSNCFECYLSIHLGLYEQDTKEAVEFFIEYFDKLNEKEVNNLCESIKEKEDDIKKNRVSSGEAGLYRLFSVYLNRYISENTYLEINKKRKAEEIMNMIR